MVIADKRLWDEDKLGPITDLKRYRWAKCSAKKESQRYTNMIWWDGWMHPLELVDRCTHPRHEVLPIVISGENACPPEDCGGIRGYKELLEVLKNPKHPEYRESKVWVGSTFNPTKFSVDGCKKEMGKLNEYI